MKKIFSFAILSLLLTACNGPTVVSTLPINGATEVDSTLDTLTVTFSEPMMDNSWSWAYANAAEFPTTKGQPTYSENNTTNTLPVELSPATHYVIWLNNDSAQNFKSASGTPLVPYKWEFWTK